jgi:hypothetical protein
MEQGTLDAFAPDLVSSDAAAVSGHIDRIIWPASSNPPFLGFVQPHVAGANQQGLPLTTLLDEQIRVQLQEEQFCTACGAPSGQSICWDCLGDPPFANGVKQPAKKCTYADCPYPEYKEQSCAHEFVVYLVAASDIKVGITKRTRTVARWQEQGATHALPLAVAPNRKAAGIIERAVSQNTDIGQRFAHEWYVPMDDAEGRLVDAFRKASTVIPERLRDCLQWSKSSSRSALRQKVVSVPWLNSPDLDSRLTSRHGTLQPGNAREGRVVGARGSLIATDSFVINTRQHAGHGITIETEAPFFESYDADEAASVAAAGDDGHRVVFDGGEERDGETTVEHPAADYF